ncbi:MAG TPA: anti-sigma regulatory factor [Jiangellaceae bacterium]
MSDPRSAVGDLVELRVPASGAYLAVLRTAAAGLAARLGFTLDGIEDLRIAVDEACAMLLPLADPGSALDCRFELHIDVLDVRVSVPSSAAELPGRETFAWTVLSALAGEVDSTVDDDGRVAIVLRKKRG